MTNPRTIRATIGRKTYDLEIRPPKPYGIPPFEEPLDDLPEICHRLSQPTTYRMSDVRRVIRAGIIGGGYGYQEADRVLKEHVDTAPIHDHWPIALSLATQTMFGPMPEEAEA